jgi:hypothetical protein
MTPPSLFHDAQKYEETMKKKKPQITQITQIFLFFFRVFRVFRGLFSKQLPMMPRPHPETIKINV